MGNSGYKVNKLLLEQIEYRSEIPYLVFEFLKSFLPISNSDSSFIGSSAAGIELTDFLPHSVSLDLKICLFKYISNNQPLFGA